ncbi:rod-determining factor RdfA (plasmid) [Haladaptatus sp. SPP-AMP-3]|uniref:rod-determining factor RdfA n=1 Tax=Haladaptatus sp. SPP-AMP-3 TaxID=3121295 RepID=UPI003C30D5F5
MTNTGHQYKVSRVAKKYDLADIGDELVELWSRDEDPVSLRDLATYFNKQVLQTAIENAAMDTLDGDTENIYRLLTDEDTSRGVEIETQKKLERNGIDVDELRSDFVTYQSVRTYLQSGRDIEYRQQTDSERIENVNRSIQQLQSRTQTVAEENLAQLNRTDRIDIGTFRVLLDLRVFCEDCETQYDVREILDQGGCRCADTSIEE